MFTPHCVFVPLPVFAVWRIGYEIVEVSRGVLVICQRGAESNILGVTSNPRLHEQVGLASLFPENPRPRSAGPKIVNAVFSRLWNLGEDSCDELENVEALAFGADGQNVV